jgi:hypothetical protein
MTDHRRRIETDAGEDRDQLTDRVLTLFPPLGEVERRRRGETGSAPATATS